ncbi:MAG: endonuclease/exonuclease/phosphatase family protein [Thermonemataceae bacterium]
MLRKYSRAMLYIGFILLIALPFLSLVNSTYWFFRAFDFAKIQLISLQFLFFVGWLIFCSPKKNLDYLLVLLLISSFIWHFERILPYTSLVSKEAVPGEASEEDRLTIVIANVWQPNEKKAEFLEIIHEHSPDLILAMETDQQWEEALDTLALLYPYSVKYPLDNLYGMHLYSKRMLIDTKLNFLVEDDIPSIQAKFVLPSGKVVNLFCLHPAPPSPTENETSKERDAELMIVGKKISNMEGAVVVCGDLNDVAWSYTTNLFKKVSGLLDPRVGRGLYPTFHTSFFFFRVPVDHLFHSNNMHLNEVKRLPYFGSDHFAMYYELALDRKLQYEQADTLSNQEKEKVKEIIKKVED